MSDKVGKMQTGEGWGSQKVSDWMREGDESEANVAGKLDTRSESRERAFDHHDTLDT